MKVTILDNEGGELPDDALLNDSDITLRISEITPDTLRRLGRVLNCWVDDIRYEGQFTKDVAQRVGDLLRKELLLHGFYV